MIMEKLKNKTVLIADDDKRNTFALRSYLESLDMKTVVSENGQDALTALQNGLRPDIILMDMMMPVMDGYETLAILKKDSVLQQIPVIAITARAMKGDKEKCMEAGAWDYMSKPINMHGLIDKITKWLSRYES
jgi:two-component system, chemotaxis family, sensor kinase CheA